MPGNRDVKLLRELKGRDGKRTHGLAETPKQLGQNPEAFRAETARFLHGLISHYVFDDGKLVVAHAGLPESMQGRSSAAVREWALFGETAGETDEFGLPVRCNWAADYRGQAMVVDGHTPVPKPVWLSNMVNIDTGCVFGGALTALRYPEREIVSVPAHRTCYEPARPTARKYLLPSNLAGSRSEFFFCCSFQPRCSSMQQPNPTPTRKKPSPSLAKAHARCLLSIAGGPPCRLQMNFPMRRNPSVLISVRI